MDIQIRYDGGVLAYGVDNIVDAINFHQGNWDKVSFSIAEDERFIIYRDGTWEHRTPESLKRQTLEKCSK